MDQEHPARSQPVEPQPSIPGDQYQCRRWPEYVALPTGSGLAHYSSSTACDMGLFLARPTAWPGVGVVVPDFWLLRESYVAARDHPPGPTPACGVRRLLVLCIGIQCVLVIMAGMDRVLWSAMLPWAVSSCHDSPYTGDVRKRNSGRARCPRRHYDHLPSVAGIGGLFFFAGIVLSFCLGN